MGLHFLNIKTTVIAFLRCRNSFSVSITTVNTLAWRNQGNTGRKICVVWEKTKNRVVGNDETITLLPVGNSAPVGIEPGLCENARQQMSRLMTKQTKWVCAQRRLRSAWASAQSDQSSLCAQWVAKGPRFLHADAQADLSLRWAYTHFVGFVMSRLKWTKPLHQSFVRSVENIFKEEFKNTYQTFFSVYCFGYYLNNHYNTQRSNFLKYIRTDSQTIKPNALRLPWWSEEVKFKLKFPSRKRCHLAFTLNFAIL